MSVVFAAGCIELHPANTIRSAAALGMVILFMVNLRNGKGERERCAGESRLGGVPSHELWLWGKGYLRSLARNRSLSSSNSFTQGRQQNFTSWLP